MRHKESVDYARPPGKGNTADLIITIGTRVEGTGTKELQLKVVEFEGFVIPIRN